MLYLFGKVFYVFCVRVGFASRKLQNIFNSGKELVRTYGSAQAGKIRLRMKVLESAINLAEVPSQKPDRRHQLKGNRKEQFAVDLVHPFRLVFRPDGQPGLLPGGGLDLTSITGVIILGVEDYHGE